jgi:catechol 2,3-dioxygenase-like lactoylglutathione lyase family enzyme
VANGQRRQVGVIRKTGAVTLASIGLFTAMAGLGMQSWPLGAVGVAMVVLAVALIVTSSFRGADRAFVLGKAYVLEVTEAPASLTHGRCEMHLQIEAPGHPPASVRVRDPRVPTAKWPAVGDVLPVRVAVDDLRRVKVLWDETLTHTPRQQDYGDADYEGVTADNEPLYDDQRPRTYVPDDRDDLMGFRESDPLLDLDEGLDGPPLPQRRRKPSPHARTGAEAPATPAASTQVLEGQVMTNPMDGPPIRVDVIDFSQAPPSPQSDVPPYTPPRQGTPQDAPGEALREEPPGEWPLQSATQEPPITEEPPAVKEPPAAEEPPAEDLPAEPAVPLATAEPEASADPYPAGRTGGSVHGVGITMLVADVGRSVAFYRDLLGFDELDSGRGNAVLASGSTRIVLRKADDLTPGNRRLTHLNLEVDDLDAVFRQLQERGVAFTYAPRVVNRGERLELWAAAFRDPDGHAINLTEWRSRS